MDVPIGLKSTALTLGDSPQWPLTLISVGMATGLVLTGVSSQLSDVYYCGVAAMWSQLIWQIWYVLRMHNACSVLLRLLSALDISKVGRYPRLEEPVDPIQLQQVCGRGAHSVDHRRALLELAS